ncbi:asparagine synthase (glutamine-hydrolyzing) [Ktedonosporobacter rubrisoli]|uniref:asparagine synthase (glutamine-hydrolyzing) n=1 Tax=Ktedonosporobacter rubrisoli TaxID=2509675 RepID=A0A4P6JQK6_KTERU|nr:asparagine synthase (glutamine-hydrolyzing) [Ktedonosporobacter rubrisoli]QBD77046.1 asparagine synthase (glutamine-hydrolyzing) [Ktedonosporobacter rubrisoli]
MCGIVGICSQKLSPEEKKRLVSRMAASMVHRGPDGTSVYADGDIGLAVSRLAIVDRNYEEQIFWNENKTLGIVFNGEIFNYSDIRRQLSKHHHFASRTDTEVALHAFEEYGIPAFDKFSGDYAFALWDRTKRQGMLVRDRIGVKPLYYAKVEQGFVFASEIKALLLCFPELAHLDEQSLYDYLSYRFVPGEKTIFRAIYRLRPGTWLTFAQHGCTVSQRYWKFSRSNLSPKDEAELLNMGRELIVQAVHTRIPKEVDYGVLLSGGLDSSLISALVAQSQQRPLHTFSIVFLGDKRFEAHSEHPYSRLVAKALGTLHAEVPVTPEQFRDACPRTIMHIEEPLGDPPTALLGILCAFAHNSATVLLSGEGADELCAGYPVYARGRSGKQNYTGMGHLLTDAEKCSLLSAEFLTALQRKDSSTLTLPQAEEVQSWDLLHQMLSIDCQNWLVDDLLLKADKMSMMSSTEIRVPYLDHRFVEFAFSLPSSLKIRGSESKYILRKIAEPYLPASIIQQQKRGFPLPLGAWLKGPLRAWAKELLLSGLLKRGYFHVPSFQKLVDTYFKDDADEYLPNHIIWSMLVLELFHQIFLEKYGRPSPP